MIAHLVLFRPHPTLPKEARAGLADALSASLREIPSIRRVRVGRRVTHGREYETLMRSHYPYAALLEFDDIPGLKAYLDHPVHAQLATRFFEAFEEALMYDYELEEGQTGIEVLRAGDF